ncbi:beta-lactamase class A [Sphingomonas sp. UYAg733]
MQRRSFLVGTGCTLIAMPALATNRAFGGAGFKARIAALDAETRGRLGMAIFDTGTGARFAWRGDERFAMCSTFKFVLAAAVLKRVEQGRERLDRRITVAAIDIVQPSPLCSARIGSDASIAELCAATVGQGDNTAANLLLPAIGGPAGLTRFMRGLGDTRSRLDRNEPIVNDATPGDPRDTTTPLAMLGLLDRLTLGRALAPASREQLIAWLIASVTGAARMKAGLPAGWRVAEKTGAGNGSDNDVALLWPPQRQPLLVSIYIAGSPLPMPRTNAIHAQIGGLIARANRDG